MKIFYTSLISGIISLFPHFYRARKWFKIKFIVYFFPLIGFYFAPLYPILKSKFLANYPRKKISRMVSFIYFIHFFRRFYRFYKALLHIFFKKFSKIIYLLFSFNSLNFDSDSFFFFSIKEKCTKIK